MSNSELYAVAPSIFASEPWAGVSSRYEFIPTVSVIEQMRKEGFIPTQAQQSLCRSSGKRGYQKHMLRFTLSADLEQLALLSAKYHSFIPPEEQPEFGQVTLVNAHDRSSSYQLDAGLYRLACSNGLMVSAGVVESVHVRHSGHIVQDVLQGTQQIVAALPKVFERVARMKAVRLSDKQQSEFATTAAKLRWSNEEHGLPIVPERLLNARRFSDQQPDLWSTFNRVQENLLRGGIKGRATTGRRMTTRGIKSVNADIHLNRSLWALAEQYTS